MSLVAFDTQVLIWAVRREASPGQERMVGRAARLVEELTERDAKILVPAVVLGEFLVKVPPAEHGAVVSAMAKAMVVAPYDAATASKYAELWQLESGRRPSRELRAKWKTDIMILATALVRRAAILYTHDDELAAIAKRYIPVAEMPLLLSGQTKLQFDLDPPKPEPPAGAPVGARRPRRTISFSADEDDE